MLTRAKLKVYQMFYGDIESWARATKGKDSSGMTDDDWYLIYELQHTLYLARSGKASAEFSRAAEETLVSSTPDVKTREAFSKLVV